MKDLETTKAKEVIEKKTVSRQWLSDNYYQECADVVQSYRCERDPVLDDQDEVDKDATSVGTPLTTSAINRLVARTTAQPPNARIRTKEPWVSELLSRHMLYCWDMARVQRQQKRHVRQAAMFGYSPRVWYWDVEEYSRHKFVDPLTEDEALRKVNLSLIDRTYGSSFSGIADPEELFKALTIFVGEHGRGADGLVKVQYTYEGYAGPKCDFILFADFYPAPHFEALQKSEYVILERRRDKDYFRKLGKAYPQLKANIDEVFSSHPNGTPPPYNSESAGSSNSSTNFRSFLARAYGKDRFYYEQSPNDSKTGRWTVTEEHAPGRKPKLRLVVEENIWIGEIDYPFDLEGRIAMTDCVLIDDILGGIGDSNARFGRGLQRIQDRAINTRTDLLDSLARPLIGTTNREFLDDPGQLKRYKHFRLIRMKGPGEMWVQGEQAAIAAAQSSLAGDTTGYQLWQMLTGETNLSQGSNVDPAQNRTATGARIAAYTGDVLSKDVIDMFTMSSLQPDVEMMYLLCRSEMTKPVSFRAGQYARGTGNEELLKGHMENGWAQIEPILFDRDDYEIEVEVGSTLADDDEAKVGKAKEMYSVATARPDLWNAQKARDEIINVMGKQKEAQEWVAPPAPPAPPPPPMRPSLSVSLNGDQLLMFAQMPVLPPLVESVFEASGIQVPPPPGAAQAGGPGLPPPGLPPGGPAPVPTGAPPQAGPPPTGPAPIPPGAPPEPPPLGASASLAARGRSPLGPKPAPPPGISGPPRPM